MTQYLTLQVCEADTACKNFPLAGGIAELLGMSSDGDDEPAEEDNGGMVCYTGGETVFQNHQMCDVTSECPSSVGDAGCLTSARPQDPRYAPWAPAPGHLFVHYAPRRCACRRHVQCTCIALERNMCLPILDCAGRVVLLRAGRMRLGTHRGLRSQHNPLRMREDQVQVCSRPFHMWGGRQRWCVVPRSELMR